jgi:indolepyruvate ferredoxin oxidoreductase
MTVEVATGGAPARPAGRAGSAARRLLGRARTAIGGQGPDRHPLAADGVELALPELVVPFDRLAIRLAGIGGTGVVTAGQILGTAAMLDGWDVRGLDQTGLSQKAGPVVSDLRLSRSGPSESNLVGAGEADLLIGFDLLVGAADQALGAASPERTVMIASSTETPTGEMIGHPELDYPAEGSLTARVAQRTRSELNRFVDAGAVTRGLHGDGSTANVFLLGVAHQAGCIPVSPETIEQAIELNGVAVDANLASFRWGRRWVIDAPAVIEAAGLDQTGAGTGEAHEVDTPPLPAELRLRAEELAAGDDELVELLAMLAADLVGYQDRSYAAGFLDVVAVAVEAEQRVKPGSKVLTEAVARGLHKLLAYKDEYEVARLLVGPEGAAAATAVGGEGAKVHWRLHPPMLRALGMSRKIPLPASTAAPVMRLLATGKRLRGTALDPFGRAEVRQVERALIVEYTAAVTRALENLSTDTFDGAVQVAELAQQVRGYEELKLRRASEVRARLAEV